MNHRRMSFAAGAGLLSIVATLVLAEVVLRILGRGPWDRTTIASEEPVTIEDDAALGWVLKPGTYTMPAYASGEPTTRLTIWPDRSRATAPEPSDATRRIVTLGGSFAQGWGVSDRQTFAWKLQKRTSTHRVVNFGTLGYGTYQSLMVLERYFADGGTADLVLYSYIENHNPRNIGDWRWLQLLSRLSSRGHVSVPYVSVLPDQRLVRHEPEAYPQWPLREWLATIEFAEEQYMRLHAGDRGAARYGASVLLIREMAMLSERHGASFAAVLLVTDHERAIVTNALAALGVAVIDCERPLSDDLVVPGDEHPNGRLHSMYAACITVAVERRGMLSPSGSRIH